jgi:phosphatidylserine/phosphatidylglycerophosphate/cardiolipin synthase-like enzyme
MAGGKTVVLGHPRVMGTGAAPSRWKKFFPDAVRTRANFLLDGPNYFMAVTDAIERAKSSDHYIYILGWMLDIDFALIKPGTASLYSLLSQAAQRGVEVRILVWDNFTPDYINLAARNIPRLNALANTKAFLDAYTYFPKASKDALAKMAPTIEEVVQKYGYLLPEVQRTYGEMPVLDLLMKLSFLLNARTLGAHHEKVVIVKNELGLNAFCGGMDFNTNRVTVSVPSGDVFRTEYPSLHDAAAQMTGAAAWQVLQRFKRRWQANHEASAESLRGMNEPKPPAEADFDYPFVQVVGTWNSVDGTGRDRSLMTAYLNIVKNAQKFIYIEDQYMVNLEVAKVLNAKIKEDQFQLLMFGIQDSIRTSDVLIPNRMRDLFAMTLLAGATQAQKDKVLFAVIDAAEAIKRNIHPGMHAKSLIADDEICVIGSANLNRRSFTNDSETCAVMFNDGNDSIARSFRAMTWKEYLLSGGDTISYSSFTDYPKLLRKPLDGFSSLLVPYGQHAQDDLDVKIKHTLDSGMDVIIAALGGKTAIEAATNAARLLDVVWENFIDPDSGGP